MARRESSSPPELSGFRPIELIGSGGYADVFLYEQAVPQQLVAVKVLVPDALEAGIENFTDEANLMARVSEHPYIVQVFQAGVAPDGRPYLMMAYYPGDNYYARAKREQMSVPEVLRTGVQLASAVETAHREGILHRDIKPANVLTSKYNQPGLTDFGIASAAGPGARSSDALSIPWAPSEAFGDAPPSVRGDVYSLAATLYTLLVGRSPFEIPGGDNGELALMSRVESSPLRPTGRGDVPSSLERVLAAAMAKSPDRRPATAADLGRQLQAIESELNLAVTRLELSEGARSVRSRAEMDIDDSTRMRGIVEVHAQPAAPISKVDPVPSPSATVPEREREGILVEPMVGDTVFRSPADPRSDVAELETGERRWIWIAAAAALAVLLIAGIATMLSGGHDAPPRAVEDDSGVNDGLDSPIAVTAPPEVVAEVHGVDNGDSTFTFTWETPAEGLQFDVSECADVSDRMVSELVDDEVYTTSSSCIEVASMDPETGVVSARTRGSVG